MLRHLFLLMWNKKRQHLLLMAEMLVSFFVLFAVFTLCTYYFGNYRKAMGFNYRHVWVASYNHTLQTERPDSLVLFYETLGKTLAALPQVRGVSFMSSNSPFSNSTMQSAISYEGKRVQSVDVYRTDAAYTQVMGMQLVEGRWFNAMDRASGVKAVVINETLRERLIGNQPATGQLAGDNRDMKIIGVVRDTKFHGDYTKVTPAMFFRADSLEYKWMGRIMVQVDPDAGIALESRLYKTLSNAMKSSNIDIQHLDAMRKQINYFALVPMIVSGIVAGFLIINVALGLFGVLWYNINKRRGEIGLRRALGATSRSVYGQLVTEALILTTFSVLIGLFFSLQFPLLHVFDLPGQVYLTAIGLSVLFIYLLVLICALYPGRQAAAIYPAVALHED